MKKALHCLRLDPGSQDVRCTLCPHNCRISAGKTGLCRARINEAGELYSLTYDEASAVHVDPVEKKPLYHYYPGSSILSVGSIGCNLFCLFCQNWEISQAQAGDVPTEKLTPQDALARARDTSSIGIAYTYNEPLINYEWVKDTATLFKENGLKNVLVTNGYLNPGPLEELLPYIDAANIDIKSFNENFYKSLCNARLAPVLETVKQMAESKKHIEITVLLIPGQNDSPGEMEKLSDWIASISPDIPLHVSRYFPRFKVSLPPTDIATLVQAYQVARKKLRYVYLGNVSEAEYNMTNCPRCGFPLIEREGYTVQVTGLSGSSCSKCGEKIPVVI